MDYCLYIPNLYEIYDGVWSNKCETTGETIEEVRTKYPNAEVWTYREAAMHQINSTNEAPLWIRKSEYIDKLHITNKIKHTIGPNSESFVLASDTEPHVVTFYARVNNRYYKVRDYIDTRHVDLLERIKSTTANN